MLAKLLAALFISFSGTALAAAIQCPPEAVPGGELLPGKGEAWCELKADRSLLHGPYRAWHPNGVLGAEENYVRGQAMGTASYRWASGNKQAEGTYRAGVRDGWWTFWDKTGAKAGRVQFKDGKPVSGELPKWALDWDGSPLARRPSPKP